jgi:hypothetical protein
MNVRSIRGTLVQGSMYLQKADMKKSEHSKGCEILVVKDSICRVICDRHSVGVRNGTMEATILRQEKRARLGVNRYGIFGGTVVNRVIADCGSQMTGAVEA